MIKIEISGNTFAEINEQLLDVVKGIGGQSHVVNHVEPVTTEASTVVAQEPAPVKRTRRSKEQIEADKAAELKAAQAEVAAAHAAPVAPAITIPSIPTTNHVVSIPTSPVVETPVSAPIVQPVAVAPAGAYTLATFKSNLVMIVNDLLKQGKVNSQWISDTAQSVFGGQDIWLWAQNEPKISELFNMFVQWGFIQKFEG